MKKVVSFIFIFIVLIRTNAISQEYYDSIFHSEAAEWITAGEGLRFLENKGQMTDMHGKGVGNLLFKTSVAGVDLYVTNQGLSYLFHSFNKHDTLSRWGKFYKHNIPDKHVIEDYCRADMELVGADIRNDNIEKEGESYDRSDYYLGGICPNGILSVHSYSKVTIKNIYPGIDWVLYADDKNVKYDFIVHPNADPACIKLRYHWTDKPILSKDSSLEISTPMGKISESRPMAYAGTDKMNIVHSAYVLENNEVHFSLGNYDRAALLTIDPSLVWGTYYAGGGVTTDVTSMYNDSINVWIAARIYSAGFPTFNPGGGAYFQGTFSSSTSNAVLMQFSTSGKLKWATYYGGSNTDFPVSIFSDRKNVWVTGYTNSSDFPTLNPGGGTYFQHAPAPLPGNAFILKFNTSGVLKWATCFGDTTGASPLGDVGYSINSSAGNVWVTGYTSSNNFPTLNPGGGAYFQGAIGSSDGNAFIVKFDTSGVLKWSTYYGGNGGGPTGSGDRGNAIQSDGKNVWVTGTTASTNFPTVNPGGGAYFQSALASSVVNGNLFISQFTTAGICKWATYYGGNGKGGAGFGYADEGNAIQSDGSNVWVTGYTSSTNFPTLNPGGGAYFQGKLVSLQGNAFILKFNTSGILKWSTYFGGSGTGGDVGFSIQNDGSNLWLCGGTTSQDFPLLNMGCGSFYQNNLGNSTGPVQDAFLSQFNSNGLLKWSTFYGVDNETDGCFASSDGNNLFIAGDACAMNTSAGYDINPAYPLKNPGGGAYYDTTVNGGEVVYIGKLCIPCTNGIIDLSGTVTICKGASTTLTASGIDVYNWIPSEGLSSTTIPDPIANPTVTTTYTVAGCNSVDSITVIVDTCSAVFIPNVFTPNGDGINDVLLVYPGDINEFHIEIFNRWGERVFESSTPFKSWDGKNTKGIMQSDGVYYYIITGNYPNQEPYHKEGFIQLLK